MSGAICNEVLKTFGSVALLWRNTKRKCFANKLTCTAQND